ncbi:Dol-P-Man:Man(5)GlcNAc(2)-PP-Dol alpha-1,3-mannosyltransferase [Sesamum alatum]|uniref:dolichyl-P-Man:Man5GlcNAc2-PP-dolichol alpha-1,3-mannosyltransferase n=1 Tax=Sesamum alatum TaxID=300844 RepID=A0AAE1Z4E1_9LAMI|nr:Dol-P-Man:Man(5)GlcNAc(2)-PP-Dol alpha-1,3-mannosyltransferase [Sesamum alatum]
MARQATAVRSSGGVRKPARRPKSSIQKLLKNPKVPFAVALLLADAVLVFLIIAYVPYTKIDWDAYMSQVSWISWRRKGLLATRKGIRGLCVYPAGSFNIYSVLFVYTGGESTLRMVVCILFYWPMDNLGVINFFSGCGSGTGAGGACSLLLVIIILLLLAYELPNTKAI